jgi:hypothetical protein
MPRSAQSRHALVLDVQLGDADAPSFSDIAVAADRIARRLSDDPDLAALRRKYDLTSVEVVRMFAPHAHHDPSIGAVTLNAGYDPGHAEGRLERLIWQLIEREAGARIAAKATRRGEGAQTSPCDPVPPR